MRRYRGEVGAGKYEDIRGRCKVTALEKIKENDYSLNPGRYIEIVETEISEVDFNVRIKELMSEFTDLTNEAHELEKKIQKDWKSIL